MNRERMEHLLKIMEDVKARHLPFDWECIYRPAEDEELAEIVAKPATVDFSDVLNPKPAAPMAHFCGSAACVIGYAALNKEFNEQGLTVIKGDDDRDPLYVTYSGCDSVDYERIAMEFFDIDYATTEYIFSYCDFENDEAGFDSTRDTDEPIRRIKKVLAGFVPSDDTPE